MIVHTFRLFWRHKFTQDAIFLYKKFSSKFKGSKATAITFSIIERHSFNSREAWYLKTMANYRRQTTCLIALNLTGISEVEIFSKRQSNFQAIRSCEQSILAASRLHEFWQWWVLRNIKTACSNCTSPTMAKGFSTVLYYVNYENCLSKMHDIDVKWLGE